MPGEVIDRPNPQPTPSHISDQILSFSVDIEKKQLPEDVAKGLKAFKRAACYIAAGTLASNPEQSYTTKPP